MIKCTVVVEVNLPGDRVIQLDIEEMEKSIRYAVRDYPEVIGIKVISLQCTVLKFGKK